MNREAELCDQICDLNAKIEELEQENNMLVNKIKIAQSKIKELEGRIIEYEAWVDRMRELCEDLP